jgi:hypothetical protein
VIRDGIPVTAPVRTLIDLATELGPLGIERSVNEADKRDLIDPEALRSALDDYAGEPGVKILRRVLDKRTFRLSDSGLEILFRPIAAAAGLRFTHYEIKYERPRVQAELKRVAARLTRGA